MQAEAGTTWAYNILGACRVLGLDGYEMYGADHL